jgi:hypothetical protein
MAPSVCTTPAAPSPIPIPYPFTSNSGEGLKGQAGTVKISGKKVLTVGGCFAAGHGNEPGTLKEVVSANTGGPGFVIMGAPTVFVEKGMQGITGSPVLQNRPPTGGGGGSASGAGGGAGGGGGGGGGAGGPGGGGPSGPGGGGGSAGGSSKGASPLKGVSQKELDLAAKPGNSKEQIKARKKVAKRFYKQKGQKYDPTLNGGKGGFRNHTAKEARQETNGIDFNKPVKVGPPPECPSPQSSYQMPAAHGGRQGQYYSDSSSKPTNLGIHDKGTSRTTGASVPKEQKNYDVDPKTPYLESTASPVKDTWSEPGKKHGTEGGDTQRYIPHGNQGACKEKP